MSKVKQGLQYCTLKGKTLIPTDDLMEWARWFNNIDNRCVAYDEVGDSIISTVCTGFDYSFSPEGPPLVFETMISGGILNGEIECYSTWDQAVEGHKRMVKRVRLAVNSQPSA